jgi:hypothetical protein
MKSQEATKVKNQKRRVADCSERPNYTDEEIAKLNNFSYCYLLDMIYYKLEQMQNFFMSKNVHIANAKRYAKQMGVAMRLIEIVNGRGYSELDEEPYVNMKNYKRFEKCFYSCYSLRKEKAWHVLFMYLERRMRNWWD